jgi:hypothetical protein
MSTTVSYRVVEDIGTPVKLHSCMDVRIREVIRLVSTWPAKRFTASDNMLFHLYPIFRTTRTLWKFVRIRAHT